jgi:hypothetical protein
MREPVFQQGETIRIVETATPEPGYALTVITATPTGAVVKSTRNRTPANTERIQCEVTEIGAGKWAFVVTAERTATMEAGLYLFNTSYPMGTDTMKTDHLAFLIEGSAA